MPQPPIPDHWKARVFSHVARLEQDNGRVSDTKIRRALEREAEVLRAGDAMERDLADRIPSIRSISRIRAKEWPFLSEKDQETYRRFYWPESMENIDLPWEATAAALELLLEGDKLLGNAWQPSIKAVRFFWQVSQATETDTPFWLRLGAAMSLMRADRNHDPEIAKAVQWFLAYRPWKHKKWARDYDDAINRISNPIAALPEDLMPLYRIKEPVLDDDEFRTLVRHWKLEWMETFGSDTLDLPREGKDG